MTRYGARWVRVVLQSLVAALGAFGLGCATMDPPQTVKHIDVERYMGVWYEIARFPVFFQRGLVAVTAQYSLEDDNRIRVKNRGLKRSFDGKVSSIEGYASIPDPESPTKLRIRFDPFPVRYFPADYWIVDLDEDYEYAVVSTPSRKTLWILSRTPSMDDLRYDAIVRRLAQRGFEVDRLERTPQPGGQTEGR